jgi:lipoprotein-releasing system permease protein
MIMMIVSVATGIGLQQKNQRKNFGFNGHIIISNYDNQSEVTLVPISKTGLYPKFDVVEGVSHIQAIASKAGIIRTENAFEGIVLKVGEITSGTI